MHGGFRLGSPRDDGVRKMSEAELKEETSRTATTRTSSRSSNYSVVCKFRQDFRTRQRFKTDEGHHQDRKMAGRSSDTTLKHSLQTEHDRARHRLSDWVSLNAHAKSWVSPAALALLDCATAEFLRACVAACLRISFSITPLVSPNTVSISSYRRVSIIATN